MRRLGSAPVRQGPWLWGAAGLVLGLFVSALWQHDVLTQTWAAWEELEQLQAQLQAQPPAAERVLPPQSPPILAPTLRESDAAWHWLRLRLQAHGLRIESWRAEPVQLAAVLHSQVATLRVQGPWADWVAFCQQLVTHAPWWQWEQWWVQPAVAGVEAPAGQVLVEAQWRLWLQPEPAGAIAPPRSWPQWPVNLAREPARLFQQVGQAQTPATPEQAPGGWRLWGVWTQAGQSHAVIGRAGEWTRLSPGQVLAAEGLRLERISPKGIDLQPTRTGGVPQHWTWSGGTP